MHMVEVWPHLDKINVNQINSQLLKNLPAKQWASQTSKLEVWQLSFSQMFKLALWFAV